MNTSFLFIILGLCFSCTLQFEQASQSEVDYLLQTVLTPLPREKTHFVLLCHQLDFACQVVVNEVDAAFEEMPDQLNQIVNKEVQFSRVECIGDYQQQLCSELGFKHHLMGPMIKILANEKYYEGRIYNFTSPLEAKYLSKKMQRFTLREFVLPYTESLLRMEFFPDVKEQGDVFFVLQSREPSVLAAYSQLARTYKEQFMFFHFVKEENETDVLFAVGWDFRMEQPIGRENPLEELERAVKRGAYQDLLLLDYHKHIMNKTYIDSIGERLLVIGVATLSEPLLTYDFLVDYRRFVYDRWYSALYELVLIDTDDTEVFKWMIQYYMGVFDAPGIFAIRDIDNLVYYRNYQTYNGSNFGNISKQFVSAINRGDKHALYGRWVDCYKNFDNWEHLWHNKVKAYIYTIGLLSVVIIPTVAIVDCFRPLFGRGPLSSSAQEGRPESAATKKKKEPPVKRKIE